MKLRDLFIPRWRHSDPDVRRKAVGRLRDTKLLEQIAEMDEHQKVREAAAAQLKSLTEQILY